MTGRQYRLNALALVCAMVLPCAAWANVNIAVVNPSFEIGGTFTAGTCGPGCNWSTDPIDGWTVDGSAGQHHFGVSSGNHTYYDVNSNGITVAWSNGGTISQTVGAPVAVGVVYTLSVDLGNRLDGLDYVGSADLFIGGVRYFATGTQAALGHWSTWTATYTGLSADVGKPITIELGTVPIGSSQGDFDNVILSATPEPGMYGALALGFCGIVTALRRRRRV